MPEPGILEVGQSPSQEGTPLNIEDMAQELETKESGLAFLGHTMFVLKLGPDCVLIDPSRFIHPVQNLLTEDGKVTDLKLGSVISRQAERYLPDEELNELANEFKIKMILYTHSHFDSFEAETMKRILKGAKTAPPVLMPLGLLTAVANAHWKKDRNFTEEIGETVGINRLGNEVAGLIHGLGPQLREKESKLNLLVSEEKIGEVKVTGLPVVHSGLTYDLAFLLEAPKDPTILIVGDTALNQELFYTLKETKKRVGGRPLEICATGGGMSEFYFHLPPSVGNRVREVVEESHFHSAWQLLVMMEMFPDSKITLTHYGGPESLFGGLRVSSELLEERFTVPPWMVKIFKLRAGKDWQKYSLLRKEFPEGITPRKVESWGRQQDKEAYATIVDLLERFFEERVSANQHGRKKVDFVLKQEAKEKLFQQVRF